MLTYTHYHTYHWLFATDMSTLRPLLDRWKDVVVMYMLRLTIAPCVESIILLDRLCYLKEHGMLCHCVCVYVFVCVLIQNLILIMSHHIGYNATMMPLFDPSISPRNFVIIANKLNQ